MTPNHRDDELDHALELTFPASDPIALGSPTGTEVPARLKARAARVLPRAAADERQAEPGSTPPGSHRKRAEETSEAAIALPHDARMKSSDVGFGPPRGLLQSDRDPLLLMAQPWLFALRRSLASIQFGFGMLQIREPHLAFARVLRFASESFADLRETYERMTLRR
jgi:hypothetical protein